MQRDKVIAFARQHATHIGFGIHDDLEFLGYYQRDILFMATVSPPRARVFTAMPGIYRNGNHARSILPVEGFNRYRREYWRWRQLLSNGRLNHCYGF